MGQKARFPTGRAPQCSSPPSLPGQEVRHGAEHQECAGEADHRAPAAAAYQPAGEPPPALHTLPPPPSFPLLCLWLPTRCVVSVSQGLLLGTPGSSPAMSNRLICLLSTHGPSRPFSVALPAPRASSSSRTSDCCLRSPRARAPRCTAAQLTVQHVGAFLPAPMASDKNGQAPTPAASPDHTGWGPELRTGSGASIGPCFRPVAGSCDEARPGEADRCLGLEPPPLPSP